MKKVLLDTNFLLVPFQFGVDIFSEVDRLVDEKTEFYTLDLCINELKEIAHKKVKGVLSLLKLKKVKIIKEKMDINVDETIVKVAKRTNSIVCTQDAVLRSKCKEESVNTIMMREKSHLSHG